MAKPTVFDFNEQLFVGNFGEKEFVKYYSDLTPVKSADRKIDFTLASGETVELKTDTYPMEATPNFFMEMYGNTDASKLGGPWRALQDNVTFFVYYFQKNKTFFWFKTTVLCEALSEIIANNNLQVKTIKNKGWAAQGYAVPRELLQAALLKMDKF